MNPVSTGTVRPPTLDIHRVGVAAEPVTALEQRHVVGLDAAPTAAPMPEMPDPMIAMRLTHVSYSERSA